MMKHVGLCWCAVWVLAATATGTTPRVVTAFGDGTAGEDAFEAAAIADNGSIYVVGQFARAPGAAWRGCAVRMFGKGQPAGYGCGVIAKLSADGGKVESVAVLAPGAAHLTSIAVTDEAVYIGGYANAGMSRVASMAGGMQTGFKPHMKGQAGGPNQPPGPLSHLTGRHGDYSGQPFVMRMNRALTTIDAATWLEGRHYVWKISDPIHWRPRSTEYRWTPTDIAVIPGGDVLVLHDQAFGESYYHGCDSVSRLSGDLKQRRWKTDIYHPVVNPPSKVSRYHRGFKDWQHPTFGQTRSQRLRADSAGNFYVCGWSVSRTSNEPWWCPFLWKFDPHGKVVWQAYTVDPMSGGGNRLGGLVSDASLRSVAVDDEGNVLAAGAGDGGNNILLRDPLDYTKRVGREALYGSAAAMKGRTLFMGTVVRLRGENGALVRGEILSSYHNGRYEPTWAIDLAGMRGGGMVAVGRHCRAFRVTDDAWHQPGEWGGFVRVYDRTHRATFITSLPDVDPHGIARRGDRYVMVGASRSAEAPTTEKGETFAGGTDAWLLVMDVSEPE